MDDDYFMHKIKLFKNIKCDPTNSVEHTES